MLFQKCGNCKNTFPDTISMINCKLKEKNGDIIEITVCQNCLELIKNKNVNDSSLLLG